MHKIMTGKRNFFGMALLLAGVLVLAGAPDLAIADGAGQGAIRLADMRVSPGGVGWTPLVQNNGVVLTVGGGDFHFRQVFRGGENPAFKPYDLEGNPLPDGVYKWQLTFWPTEVTAVDNGLNNGRDPELVERLTRRSASRSRSNTRQQRPQRMVESGAFTVLNGSILDPTLREPEAGAAGPVAANE